MDEVTLVGAPNWDPADFARYLRESDPCFGERFAKSAEECKACVAPVIVDGELLLLRDLCAAETVGARPGRITRLTSQQVLDRLRAGATVEDVFRDVLNGADPDLMGSVARSLLASRLRYLRDKGLEDVVPECPPTAELVSP